MNEPPRFADRLTAGRDARSVSPVRARALHVRDERRRRRELDRDVVRPSLPLPLPPPPRRFRGAVLLASVVVRADEDRGRHRRGRSGRHRRRRVVDRRVRARGRVRGTPPRPRLPPRRSGPGVLPRRRRALRSRARGRLGSAPSADGSDGGDAADDGGDGSFSVDLFDRYHERLLARLGALSPLVDAGEVTIHVLSAWPHGRCRSTERPPEVAAAADEKVDEKVVAVRCDVGASVEWRATVTLGVSPGASVLGTVSGRVKVASARLRSDGGVEVSAPEALLAGEKSAAEREREEERSAGRGADDLAEKADDLALDDAAPLERAAGASLEDRARAAMDAGRDARRRAVARSVPTSSRSRRARRRGGSNQRPASFDAGKKEEEGDRAADFSRRGGLRRWSRRWSSFGRAPPTPLGTLRPRHPRRW